MKKNLVFVREVAIILGVSLILGLSYNAFSPKPLPLVRTETAIVASDSLITVLTATNTQQTSEPTSQFQNLAPSQQTQTQEKGTAAKPTSSTKETVKATLQNIPTPNAQKSQQEKPIQEQVNVPTAAAKALEIRFDQVEKLLTNPDVMLIDARPVREFEAGHIGNAINIYTPEFEQNIGRIIGLPREKPIIAYCGGGACELSHELAENLIKMGFTRVFVYVGGWNEWKQKKP